LNIGQAVIATDMQGKVIYWNQTAEHIYGWSSEEALGKNIIDLTPTKQTKAQAMEIMNNLVAGQKWSGEFIVARKDGSSFPAHVTDTPIFNDAGEMIGVIGISSDITEYRATKQEK
jgi:PAS domain S-box-containing protein